MVKKSFKDIDNPARLNPALQYISNIDEPVREENEEVEKTSKPKKKKLTETRSKKFLILTKPSLYETLKARAEAEETSVNEIVNFILEEALK